MPKQTSLLDELIIDNFAGGEGASTGIELAVGRPVDIAINHDEAAIAMHKINHPHTQHYCESVWDVDPRKVTRCRPVGLAWFSPDCKHFSKAKGGKPVNKKIRGLAWVALRWAATVKPRVIFLENVEEFLTWGPLIDGRPDKAQSGRTFRSFVNALRRQGYEVDWQVLRACDFGAPTIRKRLFLIARCDGQPIVWPKPTHGAPDNAAVKSGKLKPWRSAAEIIDWSLPCPSIFDTSEEIMEKHGLRAVRPLADATLRRIARGLQKFVIDNPKPFVVDFKFNNAPTSSTEPLRTITGVNGYGIIIPTLAPWTVSNVTNATGAAVIDPINTVRTGGGGGQMLLTPKLIKCPSTPFIAQTGQQGFGGDEMQYPASNPQITIVTKAEHYLAMPTLIQYHGEQSGREVRGQSVERPLLTTDAANRYGLVTAFMSKFYGGGYQSAGNAVADPLSTVTGIDHNSIVTSHLVKFKGDEVGQNAQDPLHTVTAVNHYGAVRTLLTKHYGREHLEIVTIQGEQYVIADIGLRMLTPRELFAAQGFPPDYAIDTGPDGKPIPKHAQVARCGNAVPPPFAEALVRANLPEICVGAMDTMAELRQEMAG
ncbi:MAG: DNA cytosine methyltransferase [Oscillospiraceae bacterium]|nr:DNA cytosine methyltransferase [Oscillospiraceae bacterium]